MQDYIWRIENDNGYGPYRAPVTLRWGDLGTDPYDERRPSPLIDRLKGSSEPLKDTLEAEMNRLESGPTFGFSSPAQMRHWFTPSKVKHLGWEYHGFHIAVYCRADARAVVESPKQVAFFPRRAARKVSMELDHLWNDTPAQLLAEAKTRMSSNVLTSA